MVLGTPSRLFYFVNLQMRQKFYRIIPILFLLSCQTKKMNESPETKTPQEHNSVFFPVTDIIKGDLFELEKAPITPVKIVSQLNKKDSIWEKREDIRTFAAPFLSPILDSVTLSKFFVEKSFLDKTINAFTVVYEPKENLPDSIPWRHCNIYIDPKTDKVQKIYLVKEILQNGQFITMQLTWEMNKSCSIRTINPQSADPKEVIEEKMVWSFN